MHVPPRGLWLDQGRVMVLDQALLPHRRVEIELNSLEGAARAIQTMQVRGAPLIGACAAFGLALGLREDPSDSGLAAAHARLLATRPTAVNLLWALRRVEAAVGVLAASQRAARAWHEALDIVAGDERDNAAIGVHGASLLAALHARLDRVVNVATHCNAGALATCAGGTALAPVYHAANQGLPLHVWVSETRPRNQGLLTAWELGQAQVPHTLIADNAAGFLMSRGEVDLVIVGADRISANGDVVNKVGTYLKALAARDTGVPFYVAAPTSTIDWDCAEGHATPIEERSVEEVLQVQGTDASGRAARVAIAPPATGARNPAFDVTRGELVTGIISEKGVAAPHEILRAWR